MSGLELLAERSELDPTRQTLYKLALEAVFTVLIWLSMGGRKQSQLVLLSPFFK